MVEWCAAECCCASQLGNLNWVRGTNCMLLEMFSKNTVQHSPFSSTIIFIFFFLTCCKERLKKHCIILFLYLPLFCDGVVYSYTNRKLYICSQTCFNVLLVPVLQSKGKKKKKKAFSLLIVFKQCCWLYLILHIFGFLQ